MSFTVGVLELLGYLVPGATLVAAAALTFPALRLEPGVLADGTPGWVVYLLASYVSGHGLTILSRALTWAIREVFGHPPRTSRFFTQLQRRLRETFGNELDESEEYHLSHALVAELCPRSSERIERYFALALLTRNLAVASVLCMALLAAADRYGWAGLFAVAAGLFVYQHVRFEGTLSRAVFRSAFLALTLRRLSEQPPKPAGQSDAPL